MFRVSDVRCSIFVLLIYTSPHHIHHDSGNGGRVGFSYYQPDAWIAHEQSKKESAVYSGSDTKGVSGLFNQIAALQVSESTRLTISLANGWNCIRSKISSLSFSFFFSYSRLPWLALLEF